MALIPLPERSSVDLDNGTLNEGVRPDELVIGSVVNLKGSRCRFLTDKARN